jgi:hypothetical protein
MSQPRTLRPEQNALLPNTEPQDPISNYDEDTGLLKEEVEYDRLVADAEAVISQHNAFQEMKRTRGWIILEEFIHTTIKNLTNQLILERDFEKIRRIQSEIIAFDSLEAIMDKNMKDSEQAKEELKFLKPE